jgi:hypothetical protein
MIQPILKALKPQHACRLAEEDRATGFCRLTTERRIVPLTFGDPRFYATQCGMDRRTIEVEE